MVLQDQMILKKKVYILIDEHIKEIKNGYNPYARCGKTMDKERRNYAIAALSLLKDEIKRN